MSLREFEKARSVERWREGIFLMEMKIFTYVESTSLEANVNSELIVNVRILSLAFPLICDRGFVQEKNANHMDLG